MYSVLGFVFTVMVGMVFGGMVLGEQRGVVYAQGSADSDHGESQRSIETVMEDLRVQFERYLQAEGSQSSAHSHFVISRDIKTKYLDKFPRLQDYNLSKDKALILYALLVQLVELSLENLAEHLSNIVVGSKGAGEDLGLGDGVSRLLLLRSQIEAFTRSYHSADLLYAFLYRLHGENYDEGFILYESEALIHYPYPALLYGFLAHVLSLKQYLPQNIQDHASNAFLEYYRQQQRIDYGLKLNLYFYNSYLNLKAVATGDYYRLPPFSPVIDLRIAFDVLYRHRYTDLLNRLELFSSRYAKYVDGVQMTQRQVRYFADSIAKSEYRYSPRVETHYEFLDPMVAKVRLAVPALTRDRAKSLVTLLVLSRFLGLQKTEDAVILENYSEIDGDGLETVQAEMMRYLVSLPGGYERPTTKVLPLHY